MNDTVVLQTKNIKYSLPHQPQSICPSNISLKEGELVMLTGASGSGKTCFLDVLQGSIPTTQGERLIAAGVIRIHQDLRLVREHTVLRNVLDGLLGKRGFFSALFPSRKDYKSALYWIGKLGLRRKAMNPVYTLSAGEVQRVAIARAMIAKPMILLADEPFSALDEANASKVLSLIQNECLKRGMAALIVTHKIPHSHATQSMRTLPFNPTLEATEPLQKVSAAHQSPTVISGRNATLMLAVVGMIAALWLMPKLTFHHFSWQELGNFFSQWLPSSSEFQAMPWYSIFASLTDTLSMALLATLLAILFSLPMALIATRGIMPDVITLPVRCVLNWWRAIPSIIWALICVAAVGLGTLSGLFALVLYSMGYLTKFFYEDFEQVDRKPANSLAELGASRGQIMLLALWPMTLRSVLSSGLFMFEYNVRAASILGIVGAGGIGVLLKESVEWSNWHVVGVILFLMGFMVIAIDSFSEWLRCSLMPDRKQMGN